MALQVGFDERPLSARQASSWIVGRPKVIHMSEKSATRTCVFHTDCRITGDTEVTWLFLVPWAAGCSNRHVLPFPSHLPDLREKLGISRNFSLKNPGCHFWPVAVTLHACFHRVDGSCSAAVYSLAPSAAGLLRLDGGCQRNRCGSQCRVCRCGAPDTNLSPNAWNDTDRPCLTEAHEPGSDAGSSRFSSRANQPNSHPKSCRRDQNCADVKNNAQRPLLGTAKNPPGTRIAAAIAPTRTGQTSKLGITA